MGMNQATLIDELDEKEEPLIAFATFFSSHWYTRQAKSDGMILFISMLCQGRLIFQ